MANDSVRRAAPNSYFKLQQFSCLQWKFAVSIFALVGRRQDSSFLLRGGFSWEYRFQVILTVRPKWTTGISHLHLQQISGECAAGQGLEQMCGSVDYLFCLWSKIMPEVSEKSNEWIVGAKNSKCSGHYFFIFCSESVSRNKQVDLIPLKRFQVVKWSYSHGRILFGLGTHSRRRGSSDATSNATTPSPQERLGQRNSSPIQTQWGDATARRGSTRQQRVALQCVCTLVDRTSVTTTLSFNIFGAEVKQLVVVWDLVVNNAQEKICWFFWVRWGSKVKLKFW